MRKLIVNTMLSLDGVMQAPGGPEEDDEGVFRFGGWTAPFSGEDLDRAMGGTMGHPFDLLLGRRTYEIFGGYWPTRPDGAVGKLFNDGRKFGVSRSSPSLDWGPAELFGGDATRAVAELKERSVPNSTCTEAETCSRR